MLTVSIGIAALNEGANIKNLLESILKQEQGDFVIEEIVIVSDGSTDNTVAAALSIPSDVVRVFDEKDRQGKVVRVNWLMERCGADIFVQLDADIIFKGNQVLNELIKPFVQNPETDLVCGEHEALQTRTFVERLAKFGDDAWERAKGYLQDASGYRCLGQVRAFSKRMYKALYLPPEVGSSEDVYSFFFAKSKNFNVVYAPKAVVLFRLVSTKKDYIKQLSRLVGVHKRMDEFFSSELVRKYETMTTADKLRALVYMAFRTTPYIVLCYLGLHVYTRIVARFTRQEAVWDIANSSKILK